MSVESSAQKVIQDELQESVVVHDDNSQPSMYDLRIGPADSPAIAMECVGALNSVRTETWNLGPGRGSLTLALQRDWTGFLKPKARIKDLAPRLQAILQGCEREGVPSAVPVDWRLNQSNPRLFSALDSDGITFISWFRGGGKGKVYLTMDGMAALLIRKGTTSRVG